jgi:hypothetical protein
MTEELPIHGAIYGSPATRLKLLIPIGHPLNEQIVSEFGGDCKTAIDSAAARLYPFIREEYQAYTLDYDNRAAKFVHTCGYAIEWKDLTGSKLKGAIEALAQSLTAPSAAEGLLAQPLESLEVQWEQEVSSLRWSAWVSLMRWTLGELHEAIGHLHLSDAPCNEGHARVVLSALAGLYDLLTQHFPHSNLSDGSTPEPVGKKWMPYMDRITEALEGLHTLYGDMAHQIDRLAKQPSAGMDQNPADLRAIGRRR